jgi:hypothetical protein
VTPTLAPAPVINLPTIIKPVFLPTGHNAFQTTYQALHISQTGFLPHTSLALAIKNGAIPMPRKYTDMVIWAVEALTARSEAMAGSDGAIILADMMGISWPKENIVPMMNLREGCQLYGSEGSVGDAHVAYIPRLLARCRDTRILAYPMLIVQARQTVVITVGGARRYLRVFAATSFVLYLDYVRGRTSNKCMESFFEMIRTCHIGELCQAKSSIPFNQLYHALRTVIALSLGVRT